MVTSANTDTNRRDMLKGLVALAGTGTVAACGGEPSRTAASVADDVLFPVGDPRNGIASGVYTDELKAFVQRLCDIFLPDTDSPGAVAAGVPERFEMVLNGWMDRQGRVEWLRRVEGLQSLLDDTAETLFMDATDDAQIEAVGTLDAIAFGQREGNAGSYRRLKREVVSAYYTTEAGCTEELQWIATPGDWRSCVPLKDIGRTWAA